MQVAYAIAALLQSLRNPFGQAGIRHHVQQCGSRGSDQLTDQNAITTAPINPTAASIHRKPKNKAAKSAAMARIDVKASAKTWI